MGLDNDLSENIQDNVSTTIKKILRDVIVVITLNWFTSAEAAQQATKKL